MLLMFQADGPEICTNSIKFLHELNHRCALKWPCKFIVGFRLPGNRGPSDVFYHLKWKQKRKSQLFVWIFSPPHPHSPPEDHSRSVTNLLPSAEWHYIYGVSQLSRTLMGKTQAMRPDGQDSVSYYQLTEEEKLLLLLPSFPRRWSLPRTSYAVSCGVSG